jgi:hypothetical protein
MSAKPWLIVSKSKAEVSLARVRDTGSLLLQVFFIFRLERLMIQTNGLENSRLHPSPLQVLSKEMADMFSLSSVTEMG